MCAFAAAALLPSAEVPARGKRLSGRHRAELKPVRGGIARGRRHGEYNGGIRGFFLAFFLSALSSRFQDKKDAAFCTIFGEIYGSPDAVYRIWYLSQMWYTIHCEPNLVDIPYLVPQIRYGCIQYLVTHMRYTVYGKLLNTVYRIWRKNHIWYTVQG